MIILTKEILYFLAIYGFMLAVLTRTIFHREDDYFDNNENPFYTFNYLSFSASLYSGINTAVYSTAIGEGIDRYFNLQWVYVIFWFTILFLNRFVIDNFLLGAFYNNYLLLFNEEMEFMEKYPKIKEIIK